MKARPVAQFNDRLRVIERAGSARDRKALFRVECTCGTKLRVRGVNLRSGKTRSCGCLNRERVKLARRRESFRRKAAVWFRATAMKGEAMVEITIAQTARRLGISDAAVRSAIKGGRIRARQEQGSWYVDAASVASYRVSNRGPRGKDRRRPVLHEINVDGLTPGDIRQLDELAERLRAARGAERR